MHRASAAGAVSQHQQKFLATPACDQIVLSNTVAENLADSDQYAVAHFVPIDVIIFLKWSRSASTKLSDTESFNIREAS